MPQNQQARTTQGVRRPLWRTSGQELVEVRTSAKRPPCWGQMCVLVKMHVERTTIPTKLNSDNLLSFHRLVSSSRSFSSLAFRRR